jgi:predicted ribosome quality control (RQC) complex YloA/Tae2 family protein
MVEFLKKATEWMLEREAELAKKCAIDLEDLEKQIAKVEEKKKALERECQENQAELEKVLTKLKWIKMEELKCQREREEKAKEGGA